MRSAQAYSLGAKQLMKEEQFQSLLNCFLDTVNRFNEASKGKRVFGGMQLYQAEIHTIEAIGLNKKIKP